MELTISKQMTEKLYYPICRATQYFVFTNIYESILKNYIVTNKLILLRTFDTFEMAERTKKITTPAEQALFRLFFHKIV